MPEIRTEEDVAQTEVAPPTPLEAEVVADATSDAEPEADLDAWAASLPAAVVNEQPGTHPTWKCDRAGADEAHPCWGRLTFTGHVKNHDKYSCRGHWHQITAKAKYVAKPKAKA